MKKHGADYSCQWRKLHLGIDAQTLEIRTMEVTDNCTGDASMSPELLSQIPEAEELATVTTDGAHDTRLCHAAIAERGAVAIIPPRRNGQFWKGSSLGNQARYATKSIVIESIFMPYAAQFSDFLTDAWNGEMSHCYTISRHRAWSPWRERIGLEVTEWWCESLAQAKNHYSWPENAIAGSFPEIAEQLRQSLKVDDNEGALRHCLRIFEWGGVAKKSSDISLIWVHARCHDGTLTQRIKEAIVLLQPGNDHALDRFDGADLLMNSAMTKVYAAADEAGKIIIYDGRVGAALGLLARKMLENQDAPSVPAELAFRWGSPATVTAAKNRTRDPSQGRFRFECLPNTSSNSQADRIRAQLTRYTGNILSNVVNNLAQRGETIRMVDLEQALFMLGYDVRG